MKKYIAPELRVLSFDACDIIQTSGDTTTTSVPKTVVKGTSTQATPYGAKSFTDAYGEANSILD